MFTSMAIFLKREKEKMKKREGKNINGEEKSLSLLDYVYLLLSFNTFFPYG